MQNENVRKCVCLVISDLNGKFLTVTRKDGQGIGFPGGKVDDGETLFSAARRELWEETGVYIEPTDVIELLTDACSDKRPGKEKFEVTTYFVTKHSGEPYSKETGVVPQWSNFSELLNNSPFSEYNYKVGLSLAFKLPYLNKHLNLESYQNIKQDLSTLENVDLQVSQKLKIK